MDDQPPAGRNPRHEWAWQPTSGRRAQSDRQASLPSGVEGAGSLPERSGSLRASWSDRSRAFYCS
jgi:hypothetical protein